MEEPFDRFSGGTATDFRGLSVETGIPLELAMVIREAVGFAQPDPDDHVRDYEQRIAELVERQLARGFRAAVIERWLRVYATACAGLPRPRRTGGERKSSGRWSRPESAKARSWDITGYTRLTEERGDEAAAHLAARLAQLVQRTAQRHGGEPVKWLGDGVMFYFREPAQGVVAALEMLGGLGASWLCPSTLAERPLVHLMGTGFHAVAHLPESADEQAVIAAVGDLLQDRPPQRRTDAIRLMELVPATRCTKVRTDCSSQQFLAYESSCMTRIEAP